MDHDSHVILERRNGMGPGSFKSYVLGFIISLAVTLASYFVVVSGCYTGWIAIAAIFGLAVVQLIVQLHFFLHLGNESKPRWNMMIFLFMVLVLVILVGGSLWIMNNLNYNVMPTMEEMEKYMHRERGI